MPENNERFKMTYFAPLILYNERFSEEEIMAAILTAIKMEQENITIYSCVMGRVGSDMISLTIESDEEISWEC